jgi:hypothetical protein
MTFARGARIRPGSQTEAPCPAEGEADLIQNANADPGQHDYFGTVCIRGAWFRVRLWRQRYRNGAEWFQLKVTPGTPRANRNTPKRHEEAP